MHLKAPESTGTLTVTGAAVFNQLQCPQILLIVRLHGNGPANVLQRRHLIAQTVVSQSAEIIPAGIALRCAPQGVQCLLVSAITDVIVGGGLVIVRTLGTGIAALLIAAIGAEPKGIVVILPAVTAGLLRLLVFFRVLDLIVGGVDLLHLLCGSLIAGVQIRVVLLRQLSVCPLDLLVGCVGTDPKYLIRIVDHVSSLAFAPFPLKFTHTPL